MKKIVSLFLSVSFFTILVPIGLTLWIPAEQIEWAATFSDTKKIEKDNNKKLREVSTADAREIAAALSTPPTYLQRPTKYALYHWQTLIAGMLSFIGGCLAVVAAFVGAQALREQTLETNKVIMHQINSQSEREEKARKFEIQQIASAILGEAEFLIMVSENGFINREFRRDDMKLILFNNIISRNFIRPASVPEVFDAMRGKIGILPGDIPRQVVRFYNARSAVIDVMLQIKGRNIPIETDREAISVCKSVLFYFDIALGEGRLLVENLKKVRSGNWSEGDFVFLGMNEVQKEDTNSQIILREEAV